jgi:hypothetical protein
LPTPLFPMMQLIRELNDSEYSAWFLKLRTNRDCNITFQKKYKMMRKTHKK